MALCWSELKGLKCPREYDMLKLHTTWIERPGMTWKKERINGCIPPLEK